MKNQFKLSLLILTFISIVIYSCNSDDLIIDPDSNSIENNIELENDTSNSIARLGCSISGPDCGKANNILTYTYTNTSSGTANWIVTNGDLTIISGNGTNTISLQFGPLFNGGTISVTGSGIPTCTAILNILKCSNGNGDNCPCPEPVIDDILCVSGGHPHWRFQVNGISASDNITWSINHGVVLVGVNSDYAIIKPNAGSTSGFTVFCKVISTCEDGTTKERTAYYTNYYGNSCGTGTTGYTTSCNSTGDPFID